MELSGTFAGGRWEVGCLNHELICFSSFILYTESDHQVRENHSAGGAMLSLMRKYDVNVKDHEWFVHPRPFHLSPAGTRMYSLHPLEEYLCQIILNKLCSCINSKAPLKGLVQQECCWFITFRVRCKRVKLFLSQNLASKESVCFFQNPGHFGTEMQY